MSLLLEKSYIHEKVFCPSYDPMAQMMANHHSYHRTLYECVDQSPQSVPGSLSDTSGALFYQTQDQILADLIYGDNITNLDPLYSHQTSGHCTKIQI